MKYLISLLLVLVSSGAIANSSFDAQQCAAYFDFKWTHYDEHANSEWADTLPDVKVKGTAKAAAAEHAHAKAVEHAKSLGASDADIKETTKALSGFFTAKTFDDYDDTDGLTSGSMLIVVFERDCNQYYKEAP